MTARRPASGGIGTPYETPARASVSRGSAFLPRWWCRVGQWPRAAVVQGDAVEHGPSPMPAGILGTSGKKARRSHGIALHEVPPKDVRRGCWPGARGRDPQARGSRGQGEPRVPLLRPARHWQDHHGAHPGKGPHVPTRRRSPARRHLRGVPAHCGGRAPGRA